MSWGSWNPDDNPWFAWASWNNANNPWFTWASWKNNGGSSWSGGGSSQFDSDSDDGSPDVGAIIGGVIGGIVFLICVCVITVCCCVAKSSRGVTRKRNPQVSTITTTVNGQRMGTVVHPTVRAGGIPPAGTSMGGPRPMFQPPPPPPYQPGGPMHLPPIPKVNPSLIGSGPAHPPPCPPPAYSAFGTGIPAGVPPPAMYNDPPSAPQEQHTNPFSIGESEPPPAYGVGFEPKNISMAHSE